MKNKNTVNQTDVKHTIDERAACYMLLSRLFTDQSTSADLANYQELLAPYKDNPSGMAVSFAEMLTEWQKKEQLDHLLKTEYARIFILAGGVRPYESVYLGESKMLMQEPWVQVKKFYHNCGLRLENPGLHPEDHVSVEFTFMLYLFERDNYKAAAEFFEQHISRWVPEMLDDIVNYPYSVFYKEVALLGQTFITVEQKYNSIDSIEAITRLIDKKE